MSGSDLQPSRGALAGIRVVEIADESGAYCGKLLADLGADVVKVEPPSGDPTRRLGPWFPTSEDDRSLLFWHYNTNKRSIALDLDLPEGRRLFDALAESADVLLTTGTPADLARRGLGYAGLAERWPSLVVVAISPFGQSGPHREWKSSDLIAQAVGGMVFVNGHPGEPPLRALGPQAYHAASLHAAVGALLALLARRRTGRGQLVDVSLQEAVVATVEHVTGSFHESGRVEERRGTLHWTRTFRVGRARDGWVLLSTLGDWTSLIEWVKADGKARDLGEPIWEEFEQRRDGAEHLFDVLADWAREQPVGELVEGAVLRRLPFAAVRSLEALPANPQLRARRFFVSLRDGATGLEVVCPGAPFRMSATPWRLVRPAPAVGEHTAEIAAEIGTRSAARRPPLEPGSGARVGGGGALGGIRVLDLTWVVAGPVATRILADHGAEVIKIERPDSPEAGPRRAGLQGNLNRGKQSVALNLSDPRGLAVLKEMISRCDVLIDNFSPRVLQNWGLDDAMLRALRPELIAVRMSGFGLTGPETNRVSYGPTLQAEAGYTWHMCHAGGAPAGFGFSYSDMVSGVSAAYAVLAALWHRADTGEGQLVDLSQFEALVASIGPALVEMLVRGVSPAPGANRCSVRPAAPHGVYRCRDLVHGETRRERWVAIAVFDDAEWRNFVAVLETPGWASNAQFADLRRRLEHADELDRLVGAWTRERSAETVAEALQAAGIASGVVADAEDLCRRDPHLRERACWVEVSTPEGQRVRLDGVTARLSDSPGEIHSPGPLRGEHTEEVLRGMLGLTDEVIEGLRRNGVIL